MWIISLSFIPADEEFSVKLTFLLTGNLASSPDHRELLEEPGVFRLLFLVDNVEVLEFIVFVVNIFMGFLLHIC